MRVTIEIFGLFWDGISKTLMKFKDLKNNLRINDF